MHVAADDERSQYRNRAIALERLRVAGSPRASARPGPGGRPGPSRGAVERRLQAKQRRSALKRERRRGED